MGNQHYKGENMSRKITKEQFLEMFKLRYPNSDIEIIEYTAISKPSVIKCKKCGKEFHNRIARQVIISFHCWGSKDETRYERAERLCKDSDEYEYIKKVNNRRGDVIMRHNVCGNEFRRSLQSVIDNPFSCPYCNTKSDKAKLTIEQAQQQIQNSIKIIEYVGSDKRNLYECQKCGFKFRQKQVCLIQSRGCPKCDRWKSKGESFIINLLEENDIIFKEQVAVPELPLQHFDFGVYDENDKLIYFIEVQGEQHYREVSVFRDSLEKIQERDDKKREYCKNNNIPLYELEYRKGKFYNLDILPFSSTTISAKESKTQAVGVWKALYLMG